GFGSAGSGVGHGTPYEARLWDLLTALDRAWWGSGFSPV
ncbi:hypothetical protein A2U01_0114667, partial [Trifolium medium]|nr:hypothetical protein [Trifolium medium]